MLPRFPDVPETRHVKVRDLLTCWGRGYPSCPEVRGGLSRTCHRRTKTKPSQGEKLCYTFVKFEKVKSLLTPPFGCFEKKLTGRIWQMSKSEQNPKPDWYLQQEPVRQNFNPIHHLLPETTNLWSRPLCWVFLRTTQDLNIRCWSKTFAPFSQ